MSARSTEGAFPKARQDELIVERLADETLVYDRERDHVHCLGAVAGAVFDVCDGRRSVDDIQVLASERTGEPVDAGVVAEALRQLRARDLLLPGPALAGPDLELVRVGPGEGLSRRQMMAAGGALATLPLITTILAPTPASAQSAPGCTALQGNCLLTSQCCGSSSGDAICDNGDCCAPQQSPCASDEDCCQPEIKQVPRRGGQGPANLCEESACCGKFFAPCESDSDCCSGWLCGKGVCFADK
jgi:hypothetical protein